MGLDPHVAVSDVGEGPPRLVVEIAGSSAADTAEIAERLDPPVARPKVCLRVAAPIREITGWLANGIDSVVAASEKSFAERIV